MSRKSKYSPEQKVKACLEYLSGKKSATQIGIELGIGNKNKTRRNTVLQWVKMYSVNGKDAFVERAHNAHYSKEFKENVVREYLSGKQSILDLKAKYNIPGKSTIQSWVKKYNDYIELKDYDPKPEVYMANTLKTTYEERLEIVEYCLAHDRDIKGTALKYGCNYAQLYQWVRKYETYGEEALIDRRGKRKKEEELSDLEKAERMIAQLEREKEEYRKKYELLKKAEERERW